MIFTWLILIQIVMIVSFWPATYSHTPSFTDWNEVEKLAEIHPYVVAILDAKHEYICSGFSIADRTVVTAGSCLAVPPAAVAISAVLGDDVIGKNILRVSHTRVHKAFTCYVSQTQPSETIMNSNVALIYVVDYKLVYFTSAAVIGDFSPFQLRKQTLTAIGFGETDAGTVVLQRQVYIQKTCVNPQWFYCVCGVEAKETTYENQFGEGGPVLLSGKVVAIAGAPCGALYIPHTSIKYNIFTVAMEYNSWIRSHQDNATIQPEIQNMESLKFTLNNCNSSAAVVLYIITLLFVNNLIN
ncbi:uncharacterized protein LOC134678118 [Cydia fagiglandana]|uniref:uncharacterized protein LOC134678118 n=1 Tax=Cydia fagiglandana TaxID=1458189 RepID=UPI002FEE2922